MKDLLEELKYFYYENDFTYKDIAERIGVNPSTVYKWVQYIKEPDNKNQYRIRKFLDQHKQETL